MYPVYSIFYKAGVSLQVCFAVCADIVAFSASRKKFAQIAKVFSRRKRTSSRSLLPSAGRDQLLISADPLIDDEDDDRQQQVNVYIVCFY